MVQVEPILKLEDFSELQELLDGLELPCIQHTPQDTESTLTRALSFEQSQSEPLQSVLQSVLQPTYSGRLSKSFSKEEVRSGA